MTGTSNRLVKFVVLVAILAIVLKQAILKMAAPLIHLVRFCGIRVIFWLLRSKPAVPDKPPLLTLEQLEDNMIVRPALTWEKR